MLLCLEHGLWAPNLHFHKPNASIPALQNGLLQVVDRPLPVRGGNVAVNSFGFGGSNVHIILQPNLHPPLAPTPHTTLPRLLLASGRTLEGVQGLLEQGHRHSQNLAFVSMLNTIAVTTMPFRGYAVVGGEDRGQVQQVVPGRQRPLWFIFSGEPCPRPSLGEGAAGLGGTPLNPLATQGWAHSGLGWGSASCAWTASGTPSCSLLRS